MFFLGKVMEYVLCFFILFDGVCNFVVEIWCVSVYVDLFIFCGFFWWIYFVSESKYSLIKVILKFFYVWFDFYVNNVYDKFFKMCDD